MSDALIAAGHPARAAGLVREQLDHLPPDDLRLGARPAAGGARRCAGHDRDRRTTRTELTRQAVALVPDEPTAARAKVLAVHARTLARADQVDEGREVAMAALALAERLDMPRLASDVRTTLVGLERSVSPEAIVDALRAAIDQASAAGADNAELRGLLLLGHHHLDRGEFALADEAFHEATVRGRTTGTPWNPFAAEARWSHCHVAQAPGPVGRGAAGARPRARLASPDLPRACSPRPAADILAARGDARAGDLARVSTSSGGSRG